VMPYLRLNSTGIVVWPRRVTTTSLSINFAHQSYYRYFLLISIPTNPLVGGQLKSMPINEEAYRRKEELVEVLGQLLK